MITTLFGVLALLGLLACVTWFLVWVVLGVETDTDGERGGQVADLCTCVRDRSETDVRPEATSRRCPQSPDGHSGP